MKIKREEGREDNINFSLSLYLQQQVIYENIQALLTAQSITYQSHLIDKSTVEHQYYISIHLGHNTAIKWLPALQGELSKETGLKCPARLYVSITSDYDHCGLDIPAGSIIFAIQQQLICPLSINVITLS